MLVKGATDRTQLEVGYQNDYLLGCRGVRNGDVQFCLRRLTIRFEDAKPQIENLNHHIASKFDKRFGSSAAEVLVEFWSELAILNTRFYEILQ